MNSEKHFPVCEYTGRETFKKLGRDYKGDINTLWIIRDDGNVMRCRDATTEELEELKHTVEVGWKPDHLQVKAVRQRKSKAVRKRTRRR